MPEPRVRNLDQLHQTVEFERSTVEQVPVGVHALTGLPDEWELFANVEVTGGPER